MDLIFDKQLPENAVEDDGNGEVQALKFAQMGEPDSASNMGPIQITFKNLDLFKVTSSNA